MQTLKQHVKRLAAFGRNRREWMVLFVPAQDPSSMLSTELGKEPLYCVTPGIPPGGF